MDYTGILKRAARITWRQRALWLFGLLLAICSGGGGGGGGGRQAAQGLSYQFNHSDVDRLRSLPEPSWPLLIAFVLAAVGLVLLLILVHIVFQYLSTGALIGMVDEVEREGSTSVRSGFRTGRARFLRLLAISLLLGVPAAIVILGLLLIVLLPLPLIIMGAGRDSAALAIVGVVGMVGLFLLWLLVALVVGAVLGVLQEFMYRRCVLAGEGVLDSIRAGYDLVRRNLRDAGLTWLLLFGIRLAASVVLMPVALVALGLIAGVALAAWAIAGSVIAPLVVALPALLVAGAGLVFAKALLLVFGSTVWTLVYRELAACD